MTDLNHTQASILRSLAYATPEQIEAYELMCADFDQFAHQLEQQAEAALESAPQRELERYLA